MTRNQAHPRVMETTQLVLKEKLPCHDFKAASLLCKLQVCDHTPDERKQFLSKTNFLSQSNTPPTDLPQLLCPESKSKGTKC